MRITVVGWGNVGRTLGEGWLRSGHTVAVATRDPNSDRADSLRAAGLAVSDLPHLADADAIVLAMPGAAVVDVVNEHAEVLDGHLIVDTTNALGSDGTLHRLGELRRALPAARLFRAFTTMAWENFEQPVIDGQVLDQYYVGDGQPGSSDDDTVAHLIRDLGLNPVCLGDLDQAEHLDGLTKAWFHLVWQLGYPRRTALSIKTVAAKNRANPSPRT